MAKDRVDDTRANQTLRLLALEGRLKRLSYYGGRGGEYFWAQYDALFDEIEELKRIRKQS